MTTDPPARAPSGQYVGASASRLHTTPDLDRPGVWHVMTGRPGSPDAAPVGTLVRVGPASWVCQPADGEPFGWAGTRDDAALAVAGRPNAAQAAPSRTRPLVAASTARGRPRTVDAVPRGAGRDSLLIVVGPDGHATRIAYRDTGGQLVDITVSGAPAAVAAMRELLATTIPIVDPQEAARP